MIDENSEAEDETGEQELEVDEPNKVVELGEVD